MALVADNITKRFAGLVALSDVSLTLEKGSIVGLIGPNGSGKTTLLNVLSGVVQPTSGRISVDDKEVVAGSPRLAAREGIRRTFQNIRLFEDMTARETVEVAAGQLASGNRYDLATDALSRLGLASLAHRMARELPYGYQRRVELARALVGSLSYLLLDEPTAGLNPTESREIVDVILRVRDGSGCGVLLIDHDLDVIYQACERIVVLNEGKQIAEGPPSNVRDEPAVIEAYLG